MLDALLGVRTSSKFHFDHVHELGALRCRQFANERSIRVNVLQLPAIAGERRFGFDSFGGGGFGDVSGAGLELRAEKQST